MQIEKAIKLAIEGWYLNEANKTIDMNKYITIVFKNGHKLEIGERTLGSTDLTLIGHLRAIKKAMIKKDFYESGEFQVDTGDITYILIGS